jgi:hypothetical protein
MRLLSDADMTYSVTRYRRHTWHSEVKQLHSVPEARPLEEWHEERAQAAVYVQAEIVSFGQGC